MKTKVLLLTFFLFGLMSYSQNTYVPDDNFEQALIDLGYDDILDDYVVTANINSVTDLDIQQMNISDLTGIIDFTLLTNLNCSYNNLSTIDVSQNTTLTELWCNNNNLNALDVSQNTALTDLRCHTNNLSTLDVTQNTLLTALSCSGNNLSTLDVSQNTALTYLSCSSTNLSTLDVSQNTTLSELACQNNNLNTLDVSQHTALTVLICGGNNLSILDVSQNTALTTLWCNANNLSTLDVSQNTALTELDCRYNNLSTLDVTQNTTLTTLYCNGNNLSTLDVSQNTLLTTLFCYDNNLSSLNVKNGNNTNFTNFNAVDNPNLTCIDVDDAAWSTANWTNIDGQTVFSEDCSTMSVDDYSISGFKMYPNPVNELLTISLNEDANYSLMNLNGQTLNNGKLEKGVSTLNVSNLPSGLFFLKVRTDKGIITKKLIKQ